MKTAKRLTDLLLIAGFLAAMWVPMIGTVFMRSDVGADEKRSDTEAEPPKPALTGLSAWREYPRTFKAYYEKNFGFRKAMVRAHGLFKVKMLGVSSVRRVILGKDGWLFYDEDNAMESYRKVRPLEADDLARWGRALEQRRKWLARQNVRYLLVLVPNPPTIYPEFLPDRLRQANPESALDQLTAYLKAHSDVAFLDLRPALRAAKSRRLLYYRTDTHWNDMGAFVGYGEIMRRLGAWFPSVHPDPLSGYAVRHGTEPGGDLARFLGLGDGLWEDTVRLTPRDPRPYTTSVHGHEAGVGMDVAYHSVVVTECPFGDLPRAVILRDSYSDALIPFLSRRFERATYVWTKGFAPEVIRKERPAVVIQEIAERFLLRPVEEMVPDQKLPPPPSPTARETSGITHSASSFHGPV